MKVKGVILSIVFSLAILCIAPFSVYGETTSGSARVIGVNITYADVDGAQAANYNVSMNSAGTSGTITWSSNAGSITYLYTYQFVFDGYYSGSITLSATNHLGATSTDTYFISGNTLELTSRNLITSFSVSQNFTAAGSHDPWQYPFESFAIIEGILSQGYVPQYGYTQGGYIYPMFRFYADSNFLTMYINNSTDYYMVLLSNNNIWGKTPFNNNFDFGNLTVDQVYVLNQYPNIEGSITYLYRVKFHNEYNGGGYFNFKTKQQIDVMPIFIGNDLNLLSTDFALNFGLTNPVLEALKNLAPSQQSEQAVDDLDDVTADFSVTSQNVIDIEDTVGTGFTNALQNVPTTFNFVTGFGANFITSAQWVRDQYNTLTVNTPFGSLITFSLILGLALLLLGRRLL